jgi:D-sedoheptulose 7-phosphate isomerase
MNAKETLKKNLSVSLEAKTEFLSDEVNLEKFNNAIEALLEVYKHGGKLFLAGNGGSAADSQHLAAEFISKLVFDRNPLPAQALTTDTSTLTAIANDYGYDNVFSRQLEANATKKDMFLAITTSGNSPNLLKALTFCKENQIKSILFSGKGGGEAATIADFSIVASGKETASIQEIHILLGHSMCEYIESSMFPRN